MKLIQWFFLLSLFSFHSYANLPTGLRSIKKIKLQSPYVNKPNVKVWNAKLTDLIRINIIEFTGELPLHKHPDAGHNMLVTEGEVKVKLGNKIFKASKGDFIFIPQGIAHKYWTIGKIATLVSMDAPYYDREKTIKLE